jgi:release factor glutamine methyltransferase
MENSQIKVNIAKINFAMANSKDVFNDLFGKIHLNETRDEIHAILYLLLNHLSGLTRTQILSEKEIEPIDPSRLNEIISRINRHEPIQYIIGEANFYGRSFVVSPSVLIPRPETEQIIVEVLQHVPDALQRTGTILDIGTGSGCLAITLAKELPNANVIATDISNDALKIAASNAKQLGATVEFLEHDIMSDSPPVRSADIIVSNPPYIRPSEKELMQETVLKFEPALALFVPENDPLLFYRAIAAIAKNILSQTGFVVVEINENLGDEVASVFIRHGFENSQIKVDTSKKMRIVVASRKKS